jgi:hypothetical protein
MDKKQKNPAFKPDSVAYAQFVMSFVLFWRS